MESNRIPIGRSSYYSTVARPWLEVEQIPNLQTTAILFRTYSIFKNDRNSKDFYDLEAVLCLVETCFHLHEHTQMQMEYARSMHAQLFPPLEV